MLFFPHPLLASRDGLLAYGGDLSLARLLLAYQFGIFPWYNEAPILWWYTHPRLVLIPSKLKVAKSMRSLLNQQRFSISIDRCFNEVIAACANVPRSGQDSTWLSQEMQDAYTVLHEMNIAHSVEVWEGDRLVGGLYGIVRGKIFFGESMFSIVPNASKYGFIHLVKILEAKGVEMIDCQQDTDHMRSFGSELISKDAFFKILKKNALHDHFSLNDHDVPEQIRYVRP